MEGEIANFFWSLKDTLLFDVFRIISGKLYIFFTCAVFCIYALFTARTKFIVFIIAAVLSVSFSDLICYRILKPSIARPRPVIELNLHQNQSDSVQENILSKKDYSMPSNHASNIFAFFIVYYFYIKRFWYLLFLNSIVISLSRIILVKHYPSDVLTGMFIGIVLGLIVIFFSNLLIKVIITRVNKAWALNSNYFYWL